MNDADFKTLISKENLELAWRRITTARNHAYKRFSRGTFHIYELAVEENLNDLHVRLSGNSYIAKPPERIFIPKKSGLQRGISLLHVEDQIVYQAVANIVAEKTRVKRAPLVGRVVFSNQLTSPAGSIFFLKDWQKGYRQYLERIKNLHQTGFRWVAQFDLAAFYDTISHDLLFRTAFRGIRQSVNWNTVRSWFEIWANPRGAWPLQHGIPQGPLSSDFFAEAFLLPIDEIMGRHFHYVRYVDDIRLFGKTEVDVLRSVRQLEILCRDRGLIPQGQKFEILQTKSVKEALGSLPSLGDPDDDVASTTSDLDRTEAEKIFSESLQGRPRRIAAKTRARYVLYRAPASTKIRNLVIKLLPKSPEHIDALIYYLRFFRRSKRLNKICSQYALSSPFDYVKGELLHFLSSRVTRSEASPLVQLAVGIAKDKSSGVSAKWGAVVFLCKCEELGLGQYSRFVFGQPGFVQALSINTVPETTLLSPRAKSFFQNQSVEAGLAYVSRLANEAIPLSSIGVATSQMPSQVQHVLAALGISPRPALTADPIAEQLHKRYSCGADQVWRAFFGAKYGHAVQQLKRAEALYDMGKSEWLNYQNSFNNALFLALQTHLNRLMLPGACKTVGRDGRLVKYGNLIDSAQIFSRSHPDIASAFSAANTRRNKLPSSHPYDEKTQARTRALRKGEQRKLVTKLSNAYEQVIKLCILNKIVN